MASATAVTQMRGDGADFSVDRFYRYALWREFTLSARATVMFVGLNPSTADELVNDPTIRRCIGFAKRWGYERLVMANMYAMRSTNPKNLRDISAVGERQLGEEDENLRRIRQLSTEVDLIIAAWGAWCGPLKYRPVSILNALRTGGVAIRALGLTAKGAPRHPLYMKADSRPVEF